jgi:hypothetical protein
MNKISPSDTNGKRELNEDTSSIKVKKSNIMMDNNPVDDTSTMRLGIPISSQKGNRQSSQGVATSLQNIMGSVLFSASGLKSQVVRNDETSRSSAMNAGGGGRQDRKQSDSIAFRMKAIYMHISMFAFASLFSLTLFDIIFSNTYQKISISQNWYTYSIDFVQCCYNSVCII